MFGNRLCSALTINFVECFVHGELCLYNFLHSVNVSVVISHSSVVGILLVERIGGKIFTEFKYDRECYHAMQCKRELNYQCQRKNDQGQGYNGICTQRVYKGYKSQIFHYVKLFLSLSLCSRLFSSFSLRSGAIIPL